MAKVIFKFLGSLALKQLKNFRYLSDEAALLNTALESSKEA